MSESKVNGRAVVEFILSQVRFEPSCLDMGWQWEVQEVSGLAELVQPGGLGWLVRCSFQRPDRGTGVVTRGYGRWWFIGAGTTESGVVKTAYAAARMNIEHELMEAFRYRGVRIFDPHHTVDQLQLAAESNRD